MAAWWSPPDILRDLQGIDARLRFSMILAGRTRRGFSEAWTAPSLGSGWSFYAGTGGYPAPPTGANNPPGFYKDETGFVYLRGALSMDSAADPTIFTLPPGYRPTNREVLTCFAELGGFTSAAGRVDVFPTGEVQAQLAGPLDFLSLDDHRFRSYVPGAG